MLHCVRLLAPWRGFTQGSTSSQRVSLHVEWSHMLWYTYPEIIRASCIPAFMCAVCALTGVQQVQTVPESCRKQYAFTYWISIDFFVFNRLKFYCQSFPLSFSWCVKRISSEFIKSVQVHETLRMKLDAGQGLLNKTFSNTHALHLPVKSHYRCHLSCGETDTHDVNTICLCHLYLNQSQPGVTWQVSSDKWFICPNRKWICSVMTHNHS